MLWFRLAWQFGIPVGELMQRMSSAEFTYWAAFHALEPWGYDADNFRAGVVAAAVANTAGKKRNGQAFRPADFMPQRRAINSTAPQSVEEQRRILEAMTRGAAPSG